MSSHKVAFKANMALINSELNKAIAECLKDRTDTSVEELEQRDYATMENPSLLRFLVPCRLQGSRDILRRCSCCRRPLLQSRRWALFLRSRLGIPRGRSGWPPTTANNKQKANKRATVLGGVSRWTSGARTRQRRSCATTSSPCSSRGTRPRRRPSLGPSLSSCSSPTFWPR